MEEGGPDAGLNTLRDNTMINIGQDWKGRSWHLPFLYDLCSAPIHWGRISIDNTPLLTGRNTDDTFYSI